MALYAAFLAALYVLMGAGVVCLFVMSDSRYSNIPRVFGVIWPFLLVAAALGAFK